MNNIYSKSLLREAFLYKNRGKKSMNHRFHFLLTESPSMPSAAGEACFFISESGHGAFCLSCGPWLMIQSE